MPHTATARNPSKPCNLVPIFGAGESLAVDDVGPTRAAGSMTSTIPTWLPTARGPLPVPPARPSGPQ
jgi:hypothetical protein